MHRSGSGWTLDASLVGVAVVWGSSFLAAKGLTGEVGVPTALALRFVVAAVGLAVVCVVRRERMPRGRGLVIAAGLGCSQAAVIGLETAGVHLTSATNAGLLISLALVLTPAVEGAMTRVWLPRSYFLTAFAALAGVGLLVSDGGFRAPSVGDVLVMAAAVVRAVHVTAGGRLTRDRNDGTFGIVLVQMAVCAAGFSILAGPRLPDVVVQLDLAGWLQVLFLGLLCSVFAFVVQLWAVRRTSAARASILLGSEPVWAVAVGVTLGGEALGPTGVCGAAVIVIASYVGQAIERRHRAALQRRPPTAKPPVVFTE